MGYAARAYSRRSVGLARGLGCAAANLWLVAGPGLLAAGASAARADDTLQKVAELRSDMRAMVSLARDRVFPALVNIEVITVRYWDGKDIKGRAIGSGTIVSREGHVLTNYHVAQNGKRFRCTLADKTELPATLVGDDPLTDLAVLKLDLSGLGAPTGALPVARLGNSDDVQIGDTVMAMGSPWALSRSVTRGSVANVERVLGSGEDEAEGMAFDSDQRTGLFTRWIQHDASINPGNSGGPLVNLEGEVIGVNTLGSGFGGDMGFAIPSNLAQQVLGELIARGEVPRSYIGFSLKGVKRAGLDAGVLVNSVRADSPADKAGLKPGDIILAIDGKSTNVLYAEQIPPLVSELARREIGSAVRIRYRRGGDEHETVVTTEKLLRDRGEEAAFRAWGVTATEITPRIAQNRRLDSTLGVLVTGVRTGSTAQLAEPPIVPGDVLLALDGKAVTCLSDATAIYEEIMKRDPLPEYLLVEFERLGKNHITLVKPKPDKDEDRPPEVAKAWIGVATQPLVQKLARQLGHPQQLGFRVTRVYPGTLAAEAGLRVGDVIVSLNGTKLEPKGNQDAGLFQRQVRRLNIDDQAELTVLRGRETLDLRLKLERTRLTPEEARHDRNRDFELTVREITFFDRDENRWGDDVQGVLVVSVESASWAALGGVNSGDVILSIAGKTIGSLDEYRETLRSITREQPARVVFVVLRGVETRHLFVEPQWKPVGAVEKSKTE